MFSLHAAVVVAGAAVAERAVAAVRDRDAAMRMPVRSSAYTGMAAASEVAIELPFSSGPRRTSDRRVDAVAALAERAVRDRDAAMRMPVRSSAYTGMAAASEVAIELPFSFHSEFSSEFSFLPRIAPRGGVHSAAPVRCGRGPGRGARARIRRQ